MSGPALATLARSSKLELVEIAAAKRTDTTLRWKVALGAPEHPVPIRTKIEFSGRGDGSGEAGFAVVPDEIVQPYALQAPTVRHYLGTAAINQKIAALALRSETKARDIFDLELLLRQRRAARSDAAGLDGTHAADAADRALSIPFASFTTEIAPFLEPELAALYDEATWDAMCIAVAHDLDVIAAGGHGGEP